MLIDIFLYCKNKLSSMFKKNKITNKSNKEKNKVENKIVDKKDTLLKLSNNKIANYISYIGIVIILLLSIFIMQKMSNSNFEIYKNVEKSDFSKLTDEEKNKIKLLEKERKEKIKKEKENKEKIKTDSEKINILIV
jgi:hypothetical protein